MIVRGVEPFAWFYREAFVPDFITCVAYGLLHIIAPLLQMDRFMISPISLVHQYHLIEQVFEGEHKFWLTRSQLHSTSLKNLVALTVFRRLDRGMKLD